MEELFKDFFNENESLTYEQFSQKLEKSGMKVVNINAGGYVDKNKYDRLQNDYTKQKTEYEEYKTNNDISKYSDYDQIKTELESLKKEKVVNEKMDKISKKGVDSKFIKFVMSEVDGLVNDKNDFDKCLEKYVKDNPQYGQAGQRIFKAGSGLDLGDKGDKTYDSNKIMNDAIRNARRN